MKSNPLKYNVLLIINQKYFELAKICIHSLLYNCDKQKLNRIFIANIGLDERSCNYLKELSPKISFIHTGVEIPYSKNTHSKEWVEAVSMKTRILLKTVRENDSLPVIMMDTDMFVVKDFSHVVDPKQSVQVCKRSAPAVREDKFLMPYIGSFLIVNDKTAIEFIENWIVRIKERIEAGTMPAFETPALCEMVDKYSSRMSIGFLNEDEISCDNSFIKNKTLVIHMKSNGGYEEKDLVKGRIMAVKNYPHYIMERYRNYPPSRSFLSLIGLR